MKYYTNMEHLRLKIRGAFKIYISKSLVIGGRPRTPT